MPNRLQVLDQKGQPALEIAFVTTYRKVWDDSGSGADRDFSCWYPYIPMDLWNEGFRALGHYAKEGHGEPGTPMLIAKAIQWNALARPDGWQWTWDDAGSGADRDVSVWIPKAPPGYSALGAFAWDRHGSAEELARDLPDWPMACVRNDLVFRAEVGDSIWTDAGSGADHDLSTWRINPLNPPPNSNQTYLTSGSFCPNSSGDRPTDSPVAYALAVQLPTVKQSAEPILPRLTSMAGPEEAVMARDEFGNPIPASIAYIPCVQVNDDAYSGRLSRQVEETPFYSLEKYIVYKKASFHTNQGGTNGEFTFSYTTGSSKTDTTSIEHTIGVSLTVGIEAGVSKGPVSATASVSTTLSYSLGITTETARTLSQETEHSVKYDVPANGAGCLFVKSYLYKLKRADGNVIREWAINSEDTHYVAYPG